MAGKIIYHGECNNPPHRELLDTHLVPALKSVLGKGLGEFDVVIMRPKSIPQDSEMLEAAIHDVIMNDYPECVVTHKHEYEMGVRNGYIIVLVEPSTVAVWRWTSLFDQPEQNEEYIEMMVHRLLMDSLISQADKIISGFKTNPVYAGVE